MKKKKAKANKKFLTRDEMFEMKRRSEEQRKEWIQRQERGQSRYPSVCVDSYKQEDRYVVTNLKPLTPEQLEMQKNSHAVHGAKPKNVLAKERANNTTRKKRRTQASPKIPNYNRPWAHILYTPMKG